MQTDYHNHTNSMPATPPEVSQAQPAKPQAITIGHRLEAMANKVQNAIKNFFFGAASTIKSRVIQVKNQMATDIQSGAFKENLKTFANQIKSLFRAKDPKLAKIGHEPKVAQSIVSQLQENNYNAQYDTFRQNFNKLKQKLLNLKSGEKARVDNENNLQVVSRERRHLPKQSTERSQAALSKCLHTIKFGLDHGFFSIYDKEDLDLLMKNIKDTFSVDLDKSQGSKELRKEYKALTVQLENHSTNELFRQAEVNLYSTNPLFESNTVNAEQLYELFFAGDSKISEELRNDFLLAAPWMSFRQDDVGFEKLKASLRKQFEESTSPDTKLLILDFNQKLVERGILKESDNNLLWDLSLSSGDSAIIDKFQGEVLHSKPIAKKQGSSFGLDYQITNPEVNISETINQIAQGKTKKKFIRQLTQDIAALSRNYNQIPTYEITPKTYTRSTKETPFKNESVAFGNRLAAMVSSQILIGSSALENPNNTDQATSPRTSEERARLFESFFNIAKELETHYQDYNAAISIIGGLSNSSVINTIEREGHLGTTKEGVLKEFSDYAEHLNKLGTIKHKYITHHRKEESFNPHFSAFYNNFATAEALPDKKEAIGFNKMRIIASTFEQIESAQKFATTTQNLNYNLDEFINKSTKKWWKGEENQQHNIDSTAFDDELFAVKEQLKKGKE